MAKRRIAILASALLAPSLVLAQTITVAESADQELPPIINLAECQNTTVDRLSFSWTLTEAQAVDLYASNTANCPQPSNNNNSNAHTGSFATNVQSTIFNGGRTAADLLAIAQIVCPGSSGTLFICAFPTGTQLTPVATASVTLDLSVPPPPISVTASPGDGALEVNWAQGSGTAGANQTGTPTSYNIFFATSDAEVATTQQHISVTGGGTTHARINGLVNGTQYSVQVTALTVGSNESDRSAISHGIPERVNDFWRIYTADGGREQGGCALGAPGLLALLGVPLALRMWRRRS
jgi:hypothetical protein